MQTNTNRYEKMQKDTTIYQKYDLYDPTMYKKVPKNNKMYKKNISNDTKSNKRYKTHKRPTNWKQTGACIERLDFVKIVLLY